eukprot:tig00020611_g12104.t1
MSSSIEPVIAEDGKSVAADGTFKFAGSSNGKSYAVECQLHDEVVAEEAKWSVIAGRWRLTVPKKTHGAWPRLLKEKKPFVKCDWDLWIEEDDWKFDDTRASSGRHRRKASGEAAAEAAAGEEAGPAQEAEAQPASA